MKKLVQAASIAAMLSVGAIALAAEAPKTNTGATTPPHPEMRVATSSVPKPAITFPIAELGNCGSQNACHDYCEVDANHDACLTYAQAHNLMTREKVQEARQELERRVMMLRQRMGTTTPPVNKNDMPRKLSSTTMPEMHKGDMPKQMSSTTPTVNKNDMPRQLSSTTAPRPPEKPRSNGLGAAILKGFAQLLGF